MILALALYSLGTLAALASLFTPVKRLQHVGLVLMIGGFLAHTIWIGTICVNTGHPPITNLSEAAAFTAWVIFAVELALWIRYRVYAASFFVYPLVLLLLGISAVVGEDDPRGKGRGLGEIRDRRMAGIHADRADPDRMGEEAADHQHQPDVLQALDRREQRGQRRERAEGIQRESEGHDWVSTFENTTLSSSIR